MTSNKNIISGNATVMWFVRVLCAMTLLVQVPAMAGVAGSVHFVSGQVTARSEQTRTLTKGADIFDKDQIETAANGRVQMRFTDGALVSLMPNTLFSVEEYRLDDNKEDGALTFNLVRGGLRTVSGTIGKKTKENYKLQTPVGTLGIRGTEFVVVMNKPDVMLVHVGRGAVVITNELGTLGVPAGFSARMTLNAAPVLTNEQPDFSATSVAPAAQQVALADQPLPEASERSFTEPPKTETPQTEPTKPDPLLPVVQTEPAQIAMATYGTANTAVGQAGFNEDGYLASFSGGERLDLSNAQQTSGGQASTLWGMKWGMVTGGTGLFNGAPVDYRYTSNQMIYLVGETMTMSIPELLQQNNGGLQYRMTSATSLFDGTGRANGILDNMNIRLDAGRDNNVNYTLGMGFSLENHPGMVTVQGAGQFQGNGSGFSLTHESIYGGFQNCNACSVNISGFITGSDHKMGVTYGVNAEGNTGIGAALLTHH